MAAARRSGIYGAAVAAAVLVAASGLAAAAAAAAGAPGGAARTVAVRVGAVPARAVPAHVAGPASTSSFDILDGVACPSAKNCWAAGEQAGKAALLNQMLHWNGTSWRSFRVPNPGGSGSDHISELSAVRCVSSRDCWAVGLYLATKATLDMALHWNGKKWSLVKTPAPGGTTKGKTNTLVDAACIAAANCWTVGDYGHRTGSSNASLNQVLHWNGRKWSQAHVPNPGGVHTGDYNELFGIRCPAAKECLAVGQAGTGTVTTSTSTLRNEALRWNGKKWHEMPTPQPGGSAAGDIAELNSVACGSPSRCWAVGSYGTLMPTITSAAEILRWNGSKWTRASAPDTHGTSTGRDNQLIGATCFGASNCWAVGSYDSATTGAALNEIVHWNGSKWRFVHAPSPGGTGSGDLSFLIGVRCTARANCWAVGTQHANGGAYLNEILHWNGHKWSVH
ncbi:MAG TPA: hypothetical protein VMA32_02855 [Streptosporangiaceae bacterium]|nr:hypothetical protein [Streptosporangiaceae bacterium]